MSWLMGVLSKIYLILSLNSGDQGIRELLISQKLVKVEFLLGQMRSMIRICIFLNFLQKEKNFLTS